MKRILLLLCLFTCVILSAQTVRLGNVVGNPKARFTIPVELDHVTGISAAEVLITYNPLVLVLTEVKQGTLQHHFSKDFIVSEEAGVIEIFTFGRENGNARSRVGGSIAELTFAVREGSEGLYSDLTLANVRLREQTFTVDLTKEQMLTPANGMVRSFATDAACIDRQPAYRNLFSA